MRGRAQPGALLGRLERGMHREGVPLTAALCPAQQAWGSGTCYLRFPTAMRSPRQHGVCGAVGSRAVCSPHPRDGSSGGRRSPSALHHAHHSPGWGRGSSRFVCPVRVSEPPHLSHVSAAMSPCSSPRAGPGEAAEPVGERAGWAAEASSEGGGCVAGLSSAAAARTGGAEVLGMPSWGGQGQVTQVRPQQGAEERAVICARPGHRPGPGRLGWVRGRGSPRSSSPLYCRAARRAARLSRAAGLGKSRQPQR